MTGNDAQDSHGLDHSLRYPPFDLMLFHHFADKKQAHHQVRQVRVERGDAGLG